MPIYSSSNVTSVSINHNYAGTSGGGLNLGFANSYFVLSNMMISYNNVSNVGHGGGFALESGNYFGSFINNAIYENHANGNDGGGGYVGSVVMLELTFLPLQLFEILPHMVVVCFFHMAMEKVIMVVESYSLMTV